MTNNNGRPTANNQTRTHLKLSGRGSIYSIHTVFDLYDCNCKNKQGKQNYIKI